MNLNCKHGVIYQKTLQAGLETCIVQDVRRTTIITTTQIGYNLGK